MALNTMYAIIFTGMHFSIVRTDLAHTSVALFLTRWVTHFCAPAFVFLAGVSAYLYGSARGKRALSFFLLTGGIWLVFAELFIITLFWTFNPSYPVFNFQVIYRAIGVSMIALSVLIKLSRRVILGIGIILIAGHNLLDGIHVSGKGVPAFLWAMLHEDGDFTFGRFTFLLHYPVLPWIGIMAIGYTIGSLYAPGQDGKRRKRAASLYGNRGDPLLFRHHAQPERIWRSIPLVHARKCVIHLIILPECYQISSFPAICPDNPGDTCFSFSHWEKAR